MDIISFNEASTANERVERFNANPDSDSGVLTQPKVIEAGETVTVKSGRQAILADTVVNGDLVIEAGGDVFIPAGAGFSVIDQRIDALDNETVKLTGDQTIEDVKEFTSDIIGNITGNSTTATKLETSRTIGGVSFDGTADISLPGVNTTGDQDTTGNAASAAKWTTARTITLGGDLTGSVPIDGSADVTLSAQVADNSHNHTSLSGTIRFHDSTGNGYNNSNIEVNGNGNTIKPSIGFHQPGVYAGTLSMENANTFQFKDQSGNPAILDNSITGLGTAATRDVGTGTGNVMEVGAGGLLSNIDLGPTGLSIKTFILNASINVKAPIPLPNGCRDFIFFINTTATGASTGSTYYVRKMGSTWSSKLIAGSPIFSNIAGVVIDNNVPCITSAHVDTYGYSCTAFFGSVANSGGYSNVLSGLAQSIEVGNNIQQATGSSTEFPMSQKAVTDAINGVSDRRDKADIQSIHTGLDLIEKLNPVSFKINHRQWYRTQDATSIVEVEGEDGVINKDTTIDEEILNKPLSDYDDNDGSLKKNSLYTGFIAQDLKQTLDEMGLSDWGMVKNYSEEYDGDDRYYIEHTGLIPVLVKAVQELSVRVKELESKDGE